MIRMKPGAKTRVVNQKGVSSVLTEADGTIDWLPEAAQLSLVRRGAAVFVPADSKPAASADNLPPVEAQPVDPVDPRMKMTSAQIDAMAAEAGLDTSKLRTKAEKLAAIDRAGDAGAAPAALTDEEILGLASEYEIDCSDYDGDPERLRRAVLEAMKAQGEDA